MRSERGHRLIRNACRQIGRRRAACRDRFVSAVGESSDDGSADKAGCPCYKNLHVVSFSEAPAGAKSVPPNVLRMSTASRSVIARRV